MQRYKGIVSYDGSQYSGFQIQQNGRTIQEMLEKALLKMHKGMEVKAISSGRTDAGVHALGQAFHFDSPLDLASDRWVLALNGLLPDDISIQSVDKVTDTFHARYDATGKMYKYFLYTGRVRDPFKHRFTARYPRKLNIGHMEEAAAILVGTHDFTSFCSTKTDKENKVRTIHEIRIEADGDDVVFSFKGNGFLYNMVRIIVGTLINIGIGKYPPAFIAAILSGKNRDLAGKTAPAEGLYLWEVYY